ncbi:acyltransferase family protein [Kitasatospora sp. NPDC094015]|uniref:acyltransferase family protein n=1 Tax=Kitasatospora sp. NPDC094015 TaxID=3155205 RepID=UPI0033181C8F
MRLAGLLRSRGTLADLLSPRSDSFGFLRLALAVTVVVSHVYPLAYGRLDPLWQRSGQQTDLGKLAVLGFFVLSGYLITGSARRTRPGRYVWHRALRILPGLCGSLLVSTLVLMPLVRWHQHGSLAGFWTGTWGPFQYLGSAWDSPMRGGWDVSGVIAEGIRRGTNFDGSVNGALWSLKYELLCYLLAGLAALAGVLGRGRRLVPLTAAALLALVTTDWFDAPGPRGMPGDLTTHLDLPLAGELSLHYLVHLGLVFLLGATLRLYRERVPVHDGLAVLAAVTLLATLRWGALPVLGYPALAYLLLWLAVRLPRPCRAVGRDRDLSYGIYIYGFTVEQVLAAYGLARLGPAGFLAAALAATTALAAFSWYAVEAPALRLKDRLPPAVLRRQARRPDPGRAAGT